MAAPSTSWRCGRAEREYRMESAEITKKKAISFKDCAEGYLKANAQSWKNAKHRQQWVSTLTTYVYPVIGDMPVKRLDVGDVVRVLAPLWHEKEETARRIRARLEVILEWAIAAEHYTRDNPAKRERVKHLLGKQTDVVKHHEALPYEKLGDFMTDLRKFENVGSLPLELLILTATRTGELLKSEWNEVDWTKKIWHIPGAHRKGKKGDTPDLVVPLADQCVEIFRQAALLTGDTGLIFRGLRGGQLGENTLRNVLVQMGRIEEARPHGFRSTFKDWAEDRTNYSNGVIEAAIGHKIRDKVEEAYRRRTALEKRRHLMADWSKFCDTPSVQTGVVIPIGAA
jgi:integrase